MTLSARKYVATFSNVTLGTAAGSIMEIQVPDNTIIIPLRAWVGAAIGASPGDEGVDIALYGNDLVATGGTGMTEQPLTPAAAIDPSNCTALLEPVIAATPLDLFDDSYHIQNGWSYLPVPEEREEIIGGNVDPGDNLGIRLVTASIATFVASGGIRWVEISAA